ncbi:hypothetical protein SAMD00019534_045340 [Acytostelium subglobosum LB1]|uniref:hypothetical protein n=1 Tax=Acytostelium subglobosum LB1 TaxID=1410327 RepID=UPI0006447B21|nr:hypothetical protein SAMD00019534_045340 [Acytostelium subglobosum LB1]GAM21358.1 hypothetical protein SAMD00019534_045340 [Acytostelium subglobosum LB1]|eukprot:XP_012755477.1 hypothetical protein SAMD00019534_045340 [Acytostelium subglobosum LB1]
MSNSASKMYSMFFLDAVFELLLVNDGEGMAIVPIDDDDDDIDGDACGCIEGEWVPAPTGLIGFLIIIEPRLMGDRVPDVVLLVDVVLVVDDDDVVVGDCVIDFVGMLLCACCDALIGVNATIGDGALLEPEEEDNTGDSGFNLFGESVIL